MRVFINYAYADASPAEAIAALLERAGYEVLPSGRLLPGVDWQEALLEAITSADAVVEILSPDALISDWWQWCQAQAVLAGRALIPVLSRETASIPDLLLGLPVVDCITGIMPDDEEKLLASLQTLGPFQVSSEGVVTPESPGGIPAQAMGSLNVGRSGEAPASLTLLPNLLRILPEPFEWLEISGGEVNLSDASDSGGSGGGVYTVARFFIARHPITQAQYDAFVNDPKGYADPYWWDFSEASRHWRAERPQTLEVRSREPQAPRTGITWYEAVAFCRWLNARVRPTLGLQDIALHREPDPSRLPTVTLPTEQQWQRAAEADNDQMDLSGSILEWCMTNWGSDDVYLDGQGERILRVGSLDDQFIDRISHRDFSLPGSADDRVGFRLVCVLPR